MPAVPARKQPESAQSQGKPTIEIPFKVDGELYVFRLADMSSDDSAALRRATGFSIKGLLAAASDDLDIDVVAALLWLVRRQDQPRLPYEAVAQELNYATIYGFEEPNTSGSKIRALSDPDEDEDGGLDPTSPAS